MASDLNHKSVPLYDEVPIPPSYPSSPASTFTDNTQFTSTAFLDTEKYPDTPLPAGHERSSLLLLFLQWRIYVRTIALLVSTPSFVLILVGIITYEKSKANSLAEVVDPYTGKEIYVEIEMKPSVTFAALGGVNTLLSGLLLLFCWRSSKIDHVINATWVLALLQAVFDLLTIILTAMVFSLWKWRLFSRHGRLGRLL